MSEGEKWYSERGIYTSCCSGSPLRKIEQSHLMFPGIPQIPAITLFVPWPCACPVVQCTCVLSQAGRLSFKSPNFRDLVWCWSSGGGSRHTGNYAGLSQDSCTKVHRHGFWTKYSKEPVFRLPTLCRDLCACVEGLRREVALVSSFVPGEAMDLSQMHSKNEELSFPVCPRGP